MDKLPIGNYQITVTMGFETEDNGGYSVEKRWYPKVNGSMNEKFMNFQGSNDDGPFEFQYYTPEITNNFTLKETVKSISGGVRRMSHQISRTVIVHCPLSSNTNIISLSTDAAISPVASAIDAREYSRSTVLIQRLDNLSYPRTQLFALDGQKTDWTSTAVRDWLLGKGWNQTSIPIIVILPGQTIGASSAATAALDLSNNPQFFPAGLKIINFGRIIGAGGKGGAGVSLGNFSIGLGSGVAQAGGDAIRLPSSGFSLGSGYPAFPLWLENYQNGNKVAGLGNARDQGIIAGGGGGGAGGGAGQAFNFGYGGSGGGGGGGGAGIPPGAAGPCGDNCHCAVSAQPGDYLVGGTAGGNCSGGNYGADAWGNSGGVGGALGRDGANGSDSGADLNIYALPGGKAGSAIKNSRFVQFERGNRGAILGRYDSSVGDSLNGIGLTDAANIANRANIEMLAGLSWHLPKDWPPTWNPNSPIKQDWVALNSSYNQPPPPKANNTPVGHTYFSLENFPFAFFVMGTPYTNIYLSTASFFTFGSTPPSGYYANRDRWPDQAGAINQQLFWKNDPPLNKFFMHTRPSYSDIINSGVPKAAYITDGLSYYTVRYESAYQHYGANALSTAATIIRQRIYEITFFNYKNWDAVAGRAVSVIELKMGDWDQPGGTFTTLDAGTASGRVDDIIPNILYNSNKDVTRINGVGVTTGTGYGTMLGIFSASGDRTSPGSTSGTGATPFNTGSVAFPQWEIDKFYSAETSAKPISYVFFSLDNGVSWRRIEGTVFSAFNNFPYGDKKYYGY